MMNGMMMNPELIRIAQEQMSRMSPDDLAKMQQQMMSNPELLKMASESMNNLTAEDLNHVTEQLKRAGPGQMAEISQKMASASPEELTAMRAHADAQINYEISAAQMLKKQGNELHGQGMYSEASEKYMHAKKNLTGIPNSKARDLLLASSLNLMSCYLKTRNYDKCVEEGSEVLSYDPKNVKALYRRGQAYKELGHIEESISDLKKAYELSPSDNTIAEVLRDAKEKTSELGGTRTKTSSGLVIEEITEEEAEHVMLKKKEAGSYTESSPTKYKSTDEFQGQDQTHRKSSTGSLNYLSTMRNDPNSMSSFQNMVSSAEHDDIAKMGWRPSCDISPDMFKTATDMISRMSPEELLNMVNMASSFQGESPLFSQGVDLGAVPLNCTPEMMKMASEMMTKMSPEEFQRMFDMASSLRETESASPATSTTNSGVSGDSWFRFPEAQKISACDSDRQSSNVLFSNTPQSSFPMPTSDLQEQMRNQMNDPATKQMFASMMRNMSPEMMANMSEKFGVKLSKEDATKAQQAMASLSPEDLEKMMRWADRAQRGIEGVKKMKNWLLGKSGMILAICMLILAVILHRLGVIGS